MTTVVAGFEFPEEAKSLPMPTEEGVRLENERCLFPVLRAAGKEDQPKPVRCRKGRPFDLAMQDDELLPEQSIFGDAVRSANRQMQ